MSERSDLNGERSLVEELRQARMQQAATQDILERISRNRDDDTPVFDAILESSARLCEAPSASLFLLDKAKNALVYRGVWGETFSDVYEIGVTSFPMDLDITPVRAVSRRQIVHVHDIAKLDAYKNRVPASVRAVEEEGIRTMLAVPLFRGDEAIGCFNLIRREVRPFDDRHIALIETFAA